ncbi:meiosis-specific nuclear structural protein 1-like [Aethina tumida]|uniref:meiosis-specific nuclear structural protein 1-like n=1 Tax=Aethina tumida TaxID=116153 RepID=UPI002148F89D|nr:meiosis-specific nuclear structural protein 1-like [Aethina tumida]
MSLQTWSSKNDYQEEEDYITQVKRENYLKKLKYRRELQNQMIYQEKIKRQSFENQLKDTELVNDILLRIEQEDQRETLQQKEKCKAIQKDIKNYELMQDFWKKKYLERLGEEEIKRMDYFSAKQKERLIREKIKTEREINREKYLIRISNKLEMKKLIAVFIEETKHLISNANIAQNEDYQIKKAREDKLKNKQALYAVLMEQMREKKERNAKEKEIERVQHEKYFQEVNNREILRRNAENERWQNAILVRKENERLMLEKRQQYAEAKLANIKLKENINKNHQEFQVLLNENKTEMLQKHFLELTAFLPKKTLTNEISSLPQF